MKNIKFKWTDLLAAILGALVGAVLGGVIGYALQNSLVTNNKWVQYAAIGAALGFFILLFYRWLISGREVLLDTTEITIFGAKIKVNYTDAHRLVGWKIFVETATRISTQPLGRKDGSLREALASLYKLFDVVRTELKTQLPSAPPEQSPEQSSEAPKSYTIESYAVRMLNDALRPMLARWHPRLAKWEKTGKPEADWQLAELCRADLEATRQKALIYVRGLGEILKIDDLDNLLSSVDKNQSKFNLITDTALDNQEANIIKYPDDEQRAAGWRIFVELVSRIATQPLKENTGNIREALTSLYKLYEIIRTEIKLLVPSAPDCGDRSPAMPPKDGGNTQTGNPQDTIQSISLSILNGDLRTFLSKWHPLLLEREKQGKSEAEWDQAKECRAKLEELRLSIKEQTGKLGELLNIRVEDYLPQTAEEETKS